MKLVYIFMQKRYYSNFLQMSLFPFHFLGISDLRPEDEGFYECDVNYMNRSPADQQASTWVYLIIYCE